jgi:hypothetical protein
MAQGTPGPNRRASGLRTNAIAGLDCESTLMSSAEDATRVQPAERLGLSPMERRCALCSGPLSTRGKTTTRNATSCRKRVPDHSGKGGISWGARIRFLGPRSRVRIATVFTETKTTWPPRMAPAMPIAFRVQFGLRIWHTSLAQHDHSLDAVKT